MDTVDYSPEDALIMAPSFGRRYSGINATIEALLPTMSCDVPIACCGAHLSDQMPKTSLWRWLRSPARRRQRIWHARRNNDMLAGLFLKYVMRQRLSLMWTSAAQRRHTWLTRFCYNRMEAVIATTEKAASFLDCDSEVSHHGVDSVLYQPPRSRSKVRRELELIDRPTLGVFGRIRPQKGTCDLVNALISVLPENPEWQVVFVGQTTSQFLAYQAELESRLNSHGLLDRVVFTGFLKDSSKLPRWYQACEVVGCVSRNEGFGVTCLEGMASGSPVVATHAGAWPDIITEGNDGWLAQAADPSDLSRALRLVFGTSQADLHRMGELARAKILDRFTIQHESARVVSVYQRLLGWGKASGYDRQNAAA